MKIIEYNHEGKPKFVNAAIQVPEFKSLMLKDKSGQLVTFVAYMYDKSSPYFNILENGRAKQIVNDFFPKNTVADFLKNELVLSAGKKLQQLQMTPAEGHLYRAKQKLEECISLYNDTPVSHENFQIIAKEIERSNGLFSVIEKLEQRLTKESKSKIEGGGEKALFEE